MPVRRDIVNKMDINCPAFTGPLLTLVVVSVRAILILLTVSPSQSFTPLPLLDARRTWLYTQNIQK